MKQTRHHMRVESVAVSVVLMITGLLGACSGDAGGFGSTNRKGAPADADKDKSDEKKTDEPAEVAGAFLSCVVGVEDSIVQPGQRGVGCGVYAPDGKKLNAPSLVFKGKILDANKNRIEVEERAPGPSEDFHYIASVSPEILATGWGGMRVEKLGTNQRREFDPVLLSKAQSFVDCAPNCARAVAPLALTNEGSWALYGLVPVGGSKDVGAKLGGGLAAFGGGGNAAQLAASLKGTMTTLAQTLAGYSDRSRSLTKTPDWIGKDNSCSTIAEDLPYRDHGKVAVFSVRLLNDKDPVTGRHLQLIVAVDKGSRTAMDLYSMTAPSTHPVCAAVLREAAPEAGSQQSSTNMRVTL